MLAPSCAPASPPQRVLFQSLGGAEGKKRMQRALEEATIHARLHHEHVVHTYAADLVPVQRSDPSSVPGAGATPNAAKTQVCSSAGQGARAYLRTAHTGWRCPPSCFVATSRGGFYVVCTLSCCCRALKGCWTITWC